MTEEKKIKKPRGVAQLIPGKCIACGARCQSACPKDAVEMNDQGEPIISLEKCIGCRKCLKVCPVNLPSEFEEGLSERHAIYRPFAQSVPNIYVIDKKETPPCKTFCPIKMDVQGYIALIRAGKLAEAYALMRKTNPLPGICGRVCYHPCEKACKRGALDEPIAILALKRYIADRRVTLLHYCQCGNVFKAIYFLFLKRSFGN